MHAVYRGIYVGKYDNIFIPFLPPLHDAYLAALEKTGMYISAADAVGSAPERVLEYRKANPEFQARCNEAIARYGENLIRIAHKRATEGYGVPIVGGRNRDEVVATETKYSDGLMAMFLKRTDPAFREKQEVVHSGGLDIKQEMNLAELSQRARKKLRELLEIINEDKELRAKGQEVP